MITINFYDINGKHTVLNNDNTPMLFEDEKSAVQYLMLNHCDDEFIEECSFEEFDGDETEVYVKSELI